MARSNKTLNLILKYALIAFFLFWVVELVGYLWHRFVAHLGYLGDTIRITHYCHHEEIYPHTDFESVKYHTAHDTWPWYIPFFLAVAIMLLLWGNRVMATATLVFVLIYAIVHAYSISYIHDSYHIKDHWLNNFAWYRENRRLHYIHHLDNCNYGITIYTMDKIFGTWCDQMPPKQDIFDHFHSRCANRVKALDFLG